MLKPESSPNNGYTFGNMYGLLNHKIEDEELIDFLALLYHHKIFGHHKTGVISISLSTTVLSSQQDR